MKTNFFSDDTKLNLDNSSKPTGISRYIIKPWSEDIIKVYGYTDIDNGGYFDSHFKLGGLDRNGYIESSLYCLLDTVDLCVVGYFGISCTDIHLPKGGFNNIIGSIVRYVFNKDLGEDYLRGRKAFGAVSLDLFAVSKNYRGQIIGMAKNRSRGVTFSEYLMYKCISKCKELGNGLGANLIILHSTDAGLRTYYKYGFKFLYSDDADKFVRLHPDLVGDYIQCVDVDFKFITSRSITEDNCYPMILNI